jgi:serine/threonine protein kinase
LQAHNQSDSASLVDFLKAVQVNDVCFLPVAYQKSLGSIGKGLSGAIQQSTADISTVLTFKEGIPSKYLRDTEQEQDWYSLVTEITVLQHPQIRENNHIIDLLGVTFRVESTQNREKHAFPLLVTSKVNRGDLASFILEKEGEHLTPDLRLQLLAEVAEAITLLHRSGQFRIRSYRDNPNLNLTGVAHADIKPQNFLVEECENEFNCRLIDFGSCSIRGQKRLPTKSAPWNAPELEYAQELTTDDLIQSDIYSFGLLCVHIMIPLQDLIKANVLFLRHSEQTDDQWGQFLSAMVGRKRKDGQDSLASHILEAIEGTQIATAQRLLIQEIVKKTIHTQSDRRVFLWAEMLPHIEKFLSER